MVNAKQSGSISIPTRDTQILRWRKISIISILVHIAIVILILVFAPMYRDFFAYRIEGTDIPLMLIWMIIMMISLITGMWYGVRCYRAKVRSVFFMIMFILGCFSSFFWLLFLSAEVLFPH